MVDAYGVVDDRDQLERGFQRLSFDHRVALVLRFLIGMTPEQVAETLGINRSAMYARLERATKAMRAALEADTRTVTATTEEALR